MPTLTRAVQIIEDHVGGRVLIRERHGVRPTLIGEALVETGREIAQSRTNAEDIVDLWRDGLERDLRIGVGPMLAFSIMGQFFTGLMRDQPNYALRVVSATASRLIERLNEEELDIVLAPEQISLLQDDLVQFRILEDELGIFGGPENPLCKSSSPAAAEELEKQSWISVGALSGIYGSNKEVLAQLGAKNVPSKVSFKGDILMAIEILNNSQALCILPKKLTELSSISSRLVCIPTPAVLPKRNVAMWSRRRDRDRPEVLDFRARLDKFLSNFE